MSELPAPPSSVFLEDLTWQEAAQAFTQGRPLLLPIGALAKEHGPHLPLATDAILARSLAERVAIRTDALIAPLIGFGYYPAFRNYPGSQHLSASTFIHLLKDILSGFIDQGARRLAILNTGVSTEAPIAIAIREIYETTGVKVAVAHLRQLGQGARAHLTTQGGGHADERETSLMLAVAPQHVRLDRASAEISYLGENNVFHLPVTLTETAPPGSMDHSATGATGDPTQASLDKGERLLAEIVGELTEGLQRLYAEG